MAEDFFTRFAEVVQAGAAPAAAAAAPAPAAPAPAAPRKGLPPALWIAGLIAVVVVLLLVFAT
jgi:hypothetical protein